MQAFLHGDWCPYSGVPPWVAGHSYGSFMAANLLAHTDLFACGIARTGAFNRTLTPFGFQVQCA
jgi:dipeptidyl aminopeptidase/acylaminoacyl peptidase